MVFSKKGLAAICAIGAVSLLVNANVVMAKDNNKTIVSLERSATRNSSHSVVKKRKSFEERIHDILYPEPEVNSEPAKEIKPEPPKAIIFDNETNIMGGAVATKEQCVRYLLKNNPYPLLNTTPEKLVDYYYEEAAREGIRPDIAFAQALKETGYFRYGGTVIPAQNNYCGLGTTSATVKGAFFDTPQLGVRAHIQHLLAYASTKLPTTPVVDPRYELVRSSYGDNTLHEWKELNGRWAVPGVGYGQSILGYYHAILES